MDTSAERVYDRLMKYFADDARHLVCIPYSRANLLLMAEDLGIPEHWLHKGRLEHIDIPVRAIHRIHSDERVTVVSAREVLRIITTTESGESE